MSTITLNLPDVVVARGCVEVIATDEWGEFVRAAAIGGILSGVFPARRDPPDVLVPA
jgi:hypothetical protein